jgi:uncharacterized membrane protein YoaT (DUF817 family)
MSVNDWTKGRVLAFDAAMRPWAARGRLHGWAYEFLLFGLKQAWACLFGGAMVALLIATKLLWPAHAPIARYDGLVVAAVVLQAFMLATRLERWDEALVIAIFHMVGTAMEVFKTAHGSWIYPEASTLRIGGVPLFSGFMYAAIGSYIARIWRLMGFRFIRYPPRWAPALLALGAYVNFFTHHYVTDVRNILFVLSVLLFAPTWCVFTPDRTPRRMPILVGFLLVALFIWIAENVGTFTAAWTYPSQHDGWRPVPIGKLGAWYLLMLLSFVLVALVHRPRAPGEGAATNLLPQHPLIPAKARMSGRGLATSGSRSPGSAGAGSGRS